MQRVPRATSVTELLLIRHGEATHNLQNRWEGESPARLTPEGERQAEALARRLAWFRPNITHLYTSPTRRARQTADHISSRLGLAPVELSGLQEIDFGQVNGMTIDSFRDSLPAVYSRWKDRSDMEFQFPGGEQRMAFFQRVSQTIEQITAWHPTEQVAVVAHGGTLRAALAHLLPQTMKDWWAYSLHNASLTHVRVQRGNNILVSLNDERHIDGDPKNEETRNQA